MNAKRFTLTVLAALSFLVAACGPQPSKWPVKEWPYMVKSNMNRTYYCKELDQNVARHCDWIANDWEDDATIAIDANTTVTDR